MFAKSLGKIWLIFALLFFEKVFVKLDLAKPWSDILIISQCFTKGAVLVLSFIVSIVDIHKFFLIIAELKWFRRVPKLVLQDAFCWFSLAKFSSDRCEVMHNDCEVLRYLAVITMTLTIDELEVEHLLDSDCRSTCLIVDLLQIFLIKQEHMLLFMLDDWHPLFKLIQSELILTLAYFFKFDLLHGEGWLLGDCRMEEFLEFLHEKRSVHA